MGLSREGGARVRRARRLVMLNLALALMIICASACSARQGYYANREWQRRQCLELEDRLERQRCLDEADTHYDTYQRELEAL